MPVGWTVYFYSDMVSGCYDSRRGLERRDVEAKAGWVREESRTEKAVVTFLAAILSTQYLVTGLESGEGPMGSVEWATRDMASSVGVREARVEPSRQVPHD
jgi:hypothetical protein